MSPAEIVVALAWPVVVLALGLCSFVFVLEVLNVQKWRALAMSTVEVHEMALNRLSRDVASQNAVIRDLATKTQDELTRVENMVVR